MSTTQDFMARATAASQRIAASASVQQTATPTQAKILHELAHDRPTIHAAVTSFLTLVAARSLTSSNTNTVAASLSQQHATKDPLVLSNAEALHCSRRLLQAINATTLSAMPIRSKTQQRSVDDETYPLVAQIWNGLIASEQKPSRFLGRRSLQHAWDDVQASLSIKTQSSTITTPDQDGKFEQFCLEFQDLLFAPTRLDCECDASLLWDADGGKAELQRRRTRREQRAKEQRQQQHEEKDPKLPFIEEVKEETE